MCPNPPHSRSGISLRPAVAEDLAQVVSIEAQIQKAPWTLDGFAHELEKPHSHFWVLTDDETDSIVSGYIVFTLLETHAHLINLGVGLQFRGMGYGRLLVRRAIDWAMQEGGARFFLEVRKSNAAAVQLYQSLNFTVVRVMRGFYSDGEDAYSMELRLDGRGPAEPNEF